MQSEYVQDCSKTKHRINHNKSLNKLRDAPHIQSIIIILLPSLQPPPSKNFYLIKQHIGRDPLIRENPIISFLSNRPTTSQPNRLNILPNFFSRQVNRIAYHVHLLNLILVCIFILDRFTNYVTC
jgi:hypothetical protein